ncbi:MAG: DUF3604 domain-containing protein [Proteobacteria bacterium]|nr:DUF3604 domain-containing protein [Pseudomonadota bacterium]
MGGCDRAGDGGGEPAADHVEESISPQADKPATGTGSRLLWGDTHLHTSYSFDVFLFGTPTSTPDQAYRFARGERVQSPTTGATWQLDRPLDFLVVADHAELIGNAARVFQGAASVAETASGKALLAEGGSGNGKDLLRAYHYLVNVGAGVLADEKYGITPQQIYADLHGGTKRTSVWQDITDTADAHNTPGEFTAFIGWEWTSHPGGANLHRIVFTPTDAKTAQQFLPYSQFESDRPEDLWSWLGATRARTGADFLAMPHNSNVSMGMMFKLEDSDGNAFTADYSRRRMEWEKVMEVTQIKGDSETHPNLSPTDEFADFETWNYLMIPSGPRPEPVEAEYARPALLGGLEIGAKTGVNPFQFGMIGSTDSHTGLSTSSESAFAGKGQKDARPEDRSNPTGLGSSKGWDMGAAGLVAVWAEENTREAIFAAFKRREVYATTGTRISLRFFAGSQLGADDLKAGVYPDTAYAHSVPMGGEVSGEEPHFIVHAMKDPVGANLDRIQIVKGWLDADGTANEQVFDVAWSGERSPGPDGTLPPVGNSVDLKTGAYSNDIGTGDLKALWRDPTFDPGQSAFYYVRVLEIPTPRYSLLDAIELDRDVAETGRPPTLQERAYSSPIWYVP